MPADLPSLATLRPCLDRLRELRLVVWGDYVADRFLFGTTTRVSREAPALVLRHEGERTRPGGAGNAALNAAALGARVRAVGFVGDDAPGRDLAGLLEQAGVDTTGLLVRTDGSTPTKTRIMAGGQHTVRQQILRIDRERAWPDVESAWRLLLDPLEEMLEESDALLVSDYGLDSVTPARLGRLRPATLRQRMPVALDSRYRLADFRDVTVATPNEGELEHSLRTSFGGRADAVEHGGQTLRERIGAEAMVVTRGSSGMIVIDPGGSVTHLPIHGTDEIADVTGAGDTVIATLTLALAAGTPLLDAARLANVAAGLVVLKHGTATVSAAELGAALTDEP